MEKTLLIMAAGMGSRFGGLKQIEPFGPNGEFIIDYSIYDAVKNGFTKVVFVIKEENFDLFKKTIGERVEKHIKVEYVFQSMDNVPSPYKELLGDRTKPLGTGHAILCAKDNIKGAFAVINADDFYGSDAYIKASQILDNLKTTTPYEYAMIGYKIENTLTENGSVKRGVCEVDSNKMLQNIVECSVERVNNDIVATPLDGTTPFTATNHIASMNLLLFTDTLFPYLESEFIKFLESNKEDLSKCEYFIPTVMFNAIKENYATVEVETTDAVWYGVTYKEDADFVRNSIKSLVESGVYPQELWKK